MINQTQLQKAWLWIHEQMEITDKTKFKLIDEASLQFNLSPRDAQYLYSINTIEKPELHGHDTESQIFFYEHEYYVFSNFSAFMIQWKGKLYPTSEHAYHSEKFIDEGLKEQIRNASSAHGALKLSHQHRDKYLNNWDQIKVSVMKDILREKVVQHPYVLKKLLDSGNRTLIEDSWRDSYWGWGPDKKGDNHLGKIWMELREEFRLLTEKK